MPRRATRSDVQVTKMTALIARSASHGRARLSPLSRWLVERHDAFATMLSQYPASWVAIADALRTLGITDGKGNPPTAERVPKTWWDARRRVLAKRPHEAPIIPQPPPDEITHGVIFVREDDQRTPWPRPRLDIRPALPRDTAAVSAALHLGGPAVHAPAPGTPSPRAPEVQRILHAMDKHKPGIPEVITGED